MDRKLYQIAALLFYFAALGFFMTTVVSKKMIYSPIGSALMCVGTIWLVLSKKKQ